MPTSTTGSFTETPTKQLDNAAKDERGEEKPPRDMRFWLIFLSLCVCSFVTAIELVGPRLSVVLLS
jgi:hypothetical protein